jgi:hypothetical protein
LRGIPSDEGAEGYVAITTECSKATTTEDACEKKATARTAERDMKEEAARRRKASSSIGDSAEGRAEEDEEEAMVVDRDGREEAGGESGGGEERENRPKAARGDRGSGEEGIERGCRSGAPMTTCSRRMWENCVPTNKRVPSGDQRRQVMESSTIGHNGEGGRPSLMLRSSATTGVAESEAEEIITRSLSAKAKSPAEDQSTTRSRGSSGKLAAACVTRGREGRDENVDEIRS